MKLDLTSHVKLMTLFGTVSSEVANDNSSRILFFLIFAIKKNKIQLLRKFFLKRYFESIAITTHTFGSQLIWVSIRSCQDLLEFIFPGSSVYSESVFSEAGLVYTKPRGVASYQQMRKI